MNSTGHTRRLLVVGSSLVLMLLIAWADLLVHRAIPLGLLYLLPMGWASTVLRRRAVGPLALICTGAAEFGDAFPWTWTEGMPRDLLYFVAYAAIGLYVSEVLAKRDAERMHLQVAEAEAAARRSAEQQLRLLLASSPVAIVTSDESGNILEANDAAERIFRADEEEPAMPEAPEPHTAALPETLVAEDGATGSDRLPVAESAPAKTALEETRGPLTGQPLLNFLPSLARLSLDRAGQPPLRTMMQCQGTRANGDFFLADVWFSTYETPRGARITAMVVDTSEDVRDREEANLEQVLEGSRLLVGAVSHEIRNVCAAIGLVQGNLQARVAGLRDEPDFQALLQLTAALERMSSVELSQVKRQPAELDPEPFFRDLRVMVAGTARSAGIALRWEIAQDLPHVRADAQALMQVLLNLVRNAETALRGTSRPTLTVSSVVREGVLEIRVADNGPGVAHPELLFRPFASGSRRTGFGLYLSRAMMKAARGDLRHERSEEGAVFVIELIIWPPQRAAADNHHTAGHTMLARSW